MSIVNSLIFHSVARMDIWPCNVSFSSCYVLVVSIIWFPSIPFPKSVFHIFFGLTHSSRQRWFHGCHFDGREQRNSNGDKETRKREKGKIEIKIFTNQNNNNKSNYCSIVNLTATKFSPSTSLFEPLSSHASRIVKIKNYCSFALAKQQKSNSTSHQLGIRAVLTFHCKHSHAYALTQCRPFFVMWVFLLDNNQLNRSHTQNFSWTRY